MRILHFSDVHLARPILRMPFVDWLGKRLLAAGHLVLTRGRLFSDAGRKLEALKAFMDESGVDLVIFTGDYTAMGTDGELAQARRAFQPLMNAPLGYVNVPGNHDLYLNDVIRQRRFERYFEDTLVTDLEEYRVDGFWPLVRLLDGVAVVAVNSARPNPPPWRSSGRIPPAQLEALRRIVRDRRVRDRFVFVITHYAPRLGDGSRDRPHHCLVNADDYLDAVAGLPRGVILCGHVHHRYRVRIPDVGPEVFCAGSATMVAREGFWLFDVGGEAATVASGSWNHDRYTTAPPVSLLA